jgi:hypothetical protein
MMMKDFWNDIYLCYKNYNNGGEYNTTNYKCIKFGNYESAEKYYKNILIKTNKNIETATFIPVCKFIPKMIVNNIIRYKVAKLILFIRIIK